MEYPGRNHVLVNRDGCSGIVTPFPPARLSQAISTIIYVGGYVVERHAPPAFAR
jgi:hypothetical protein